MLLWLGRFTPEHSQTEIPKLLLDARRHIVLALFENPDDTSQVSAYVRAYLLEDTSGFRVGPDSFVAQYHYAQEKQLILAESSPGHFPGFSGRVTIYFGKNFVATKVGIQLFNQGLPARCRTPIHRIHIHGEAPPLFFKLLAGIPATKPGQL